MMDRVKEALFSSLGGGVVGARVLDLYAGSGSLGIEALSRGAASATFVERDRPALAALRANVESVGLGGEVIAADVKAYLADTAGEFDLVFVDPPYRLSLALLEDVLAAAASVLGNGGVMVVHRRAGEAQPSAPGATTVRGDRKYGDARLWMFERAAE